MQYNGSGAMDSFGRWEQTIVSDTKPLDRITFNKHVLGGKPTIRGLRISVEMILELLAAGESERDILDDYPELEPDDIRAVLAYRRAAW